MLAAQLKKNLDASMDRRKFFEWLGVCGPGLSSLVLARPTRDLLLGQQLASTAQTRPLMGTLVTVTVYHPSGDKATEGMEKAFAEMERLVPLFDRHAPDTPVSPS